jgi:hypothetical protein
LYPPSHPPYPLQNKKDKYLKYNIKREREREKNIVKKAS